MLGNSVSSGLSHPPQSLEDRAGSGKIRAHYIAQRVIGDGVRELPVARSSPDSGRGTRMGNDVTLDADDVSCVP